MADLVKEGAHFDLPIALGFSIAMGVVSPDAITGVKRMLLFDGVNCEGRDIYT